MGSSQRNELGELIEKQRLRRGKTYADLDRYVYGHKANAHRVIRGEQGVAPDKAIRYQQVLKFEGADLWLFLNFTGLRPLVDQLPALIGLRASIAETITLPGNSNISVEDLLALGEDTGESEFQSGEFFLLWGTVLDRRGKWQDAMNKFVRADELLPLTSTKGKAIIDLAQEHVNLGDLSGSRLVMARVLPSDGTPEWLDRVTLGQAYSRRGQLNSLQGRYQEAVDDLTKAAAIGKQYGDRILEAVALHYLGRTNYGLAMDGERNRLLDALRYFATAKEINARFPLLMAHDLRWLARVHEWQGNLDEATPLRLQALEIFSGEPKRLGVAHILLDEGRLATRKDDLREAEQKLDEALHLWGEVGYAKGTADCLAALGDLSLSTGRRSDVIKALSYGIAALLLYPDATMPAANNARLLLKKTRGRLSDRHLYDRDLARIQDQIDQHEGIFVYLPAEVNHTPRLFQIRRLLEAP